MAVCSFIVGFILVMTRFVSGLSETKQGCRTVSYVVHHLHQTNSYCENTTSAVPNAALEDIRSQFARLQEKMEALQKSYTQLQEEHTKLSVSLKNTPAIGFHVALTSGSQTASGKIRFNKIIKNYGNAWSSSNHTFRAPVKGLYTFTFTFMNGVSSGFAHADIMLENVQLQKGYAYQKYDTGSATTVTMMNPGEHAFVQRKGGTIYGGNDAITHFAGYIISSY